MFLKCFTLDDHLRRARIKVSVSLWITGHPYYDESSLFIAILTHIQYLKSKSSVPVITQEPRVSDMFGSLDMIAISQNVILRHLKWLWDVRSECYGQPMVRDCFSTLFVSLQLSHSIVIHSTWLPATITNECHSPLVIQSCKSGQGSWTHALTHK